MLLRFGVACYGKARERKCICINIRYLWPLWWRVESPVDSDKVEEATKTPHCYCLYQQHYRSCVSTSLTVALLWEAAIGHSGITPIQRIGFSRLREHNKLNWSYCAHGRIATSDVATPSTPWSLLNLATLTQPTDLTLWIKNEPHLHPINMPSSNGKINFLKIKFKLILVS